MRIASESLLIIFARTVSGLSGYVVLGLAANKLTPSQFAELALFQTLIFLTQVFFDSGVVQLATRESAGNPAWRQLTSEYQRVRYTTALTVGALFCAVGLLGWLPTADLALFAASAACLISAPLNADWVLFSQQERRKWAFKIILVGLSNVLLGFLLLHFRSEPSAVLVATALSNALAGLYLYHSKLIAAPGIRMPSKQQIRAAMQLSISGMLIHTGYNLPVAVATSALGGFSAGSFACLYRLFSACTMFVPPVLEFTVTREIARLRGATVGRAGIRVLAEFILTALLLISPVVVCPTEWLHDLASTVIDLGKYGISPDHMNLVKVALVLYCLEFSTQRTAYALGHRRLLIVSSVAGLGVAIPFLTWTVTLAAASGPIEPAGWFYPIFAYQLLASSALLHRISCPKRLPSSK